VSALPEDIADAVEFSGLQNDSVCLGVDQPRQGNIRQSREFVLGEAEQFSLSL
jgi:hypothetical protein